MRATPLRALATACMVLSACAPSVHAQVNNSSGQVYRLLKTSTYEEGCFNACNCVTHYHGDLRGTMRVRLEYIGDVTDFYSVSDVRLTTNVNSVTFTGSGIYRVAIQSVEPLEYQGTLELDLNQPGFGVRLFDGGPSPATGANAYPPIDISIDANDQQCYDQVLHIVARPVSADWNASGSVTIQDLFEFLADWFSADPSACYSGSATPGVQDLFTFLRDWFLKV